MYSIHIYCQKPRDWECLRAMEVKFEKVDEDKNVCVAVVKGVSNKMSDISNCCDRVLLKILKNCSFLGKANSGTLCCFLEQRELCLCPSALFWAPEFVWVDQPSIACFSHSFVKSIKWVIQTKTFPVWASLAFNAGLLADDAPPMTSSLHTHCAFEEHATVCPTIHRFDRDPTFSAWKTEPTFCYILCARLFQLSCTVEIPWQQQWRLW
jgi:hypothetical protein